MTGSFNSISISKIKSPHLFLIVGLSIFLYSCEMPVRFDRNNPKDPESQLYFPTGPSNVTVKSYAMEIYEISWEDNSITEQKYIVERRINDGEYTLIREVPPGTSSILDTTSVFGVYQYRIAGVYHTGIKYSDPSDAIEIKYFLQTPQRNFSSGSLIPLTEGRIIAYSATGFEIYDPAIHKWIKIDQPGSFQQTLIATQLSTGLLIALGIRPGNNDHNIYIEIWDPASEVWIPHGHLIRGWQISDPNLPDRGFQKIGALPLRDGRVFIHGSTFNTLTSKHIPIAELFEPSTGEIIKADSEEIIFSYYHSQHNQPAVQLNNGELFLIFDETPLLFNPSSNQWRKASQIYYTPRITTLLHLSNGNVLASEGVRSGFSTYLYNPETDTWTDLWREEYYNYGMYVRFLLNLTENEALAVTSKMPIFDITSNTWRESPARLPIIVRSAAKLPNGYVLIIGDSDTALVFRPGEDY